MAERKTKPLGCSFAFPWRKLVAVAGVDAEVEERVEPVTEPNIMGCRKHHIFALCSWLWYAMMIRKRKNIADADAARQDCGGGHQ